MTENEAIQAIKKEMQCVSTCDRGMDCDCELLLSEADVLASHKMAIKAIEEIQQYRAIGTVEEIQKNMAELGRWHSNRINDKIKNPFAHTSTLICHNCDHKDEYIEELEFEIEEYRKIGTVEECEEAMERQRAKKPNKRFRIWYKMWKMCSMRK